MGPLEEVLRENIRSLDSSRRIRRKIKKYADARGVSTEEYLVQVQKHIENIAESSEMFCARHVSSLEDLLIGDGRLKSSFEVNNHGTRLPLHKWQRMKKEFKLFGFPENESSVTKRPIYGYISTLPNGEVQQRKCFNAMKKFGNIHLKFKNKMRSRATLTFNESFDALFGGFIASPLSKSHYLSAPFLKGDPLDLPPSSLAPHYYETQLHGGVDFRDIESVHIQKGCMSSEEYNRVTEAVKKYQQGSRWSENPIQLIEYTYD